MESFPNVFVPKRKHNFEQNLFQEFMKKFRYKLYLHILQHSPEVYFNMEELTSKFNLSEDKILEGMNKVKGELKERGWVAEFLYNNTAICVYDKDTKEIPKICQNFGEVLGDYDTSSNVDLRL